MPLKLPFPPVLMSLSILPYPPVLLKRSEEAEMSSKLSEGYSGYMHLVERQMLFHEEVAKLIRTHETKEVAHPFHFITISRDAGALGEAVASELARRLHWKVYDREIVDYIAKHNHVLYGLVSQLDERTQNHIQDSIERLLLTFHGQVFSNDVYHVSLIQALVALSGQGQCILLDHGGTYALQEQAGLHIRVTASLPVRVRRLSSQWGIPFEKAKKLVQKTDRERADFIQHHFMADPNETKYFHIVLNTDKLAIDCAVSAIAGILQKNVDPEGPMSESLFRA